MTSLLVVGEVLAEFMRPSRDSPLNETGVMMGPFPSGAPRVFASAATRLGIPTALCAAVGDDPFAGSSAIVFSTTGSTSTVS